MQISEKWKECTNITGFRNPITWLPPWASHRHPSMSSELSVNVRCILLRLCSESLLHVCKLSPTPPFYLLLFLLTRLLQSSFPPSSILSSDAILVHQEPNVAALFIYYLGVSAKQGTPDGHLPPAFIWWKWRMEGWLEKISFAEKKTAEERWLQKKT